jgi:hypothetical protein
MNMPTVYPLDSVRFCLAPRGQYPSDAIATFTRYPPMPAPLYEHRARMSSRTAAKLMRRLLSLGYTCFHKASYDDFRVRYEHLRFDRPKKRKAKGA